MPTCPRCGDRVPFGGGRTAKNAAEMLTLADRIEGLLAELQAHRDEVYQAARDDGVSDPEREAEEETKHIREFVSGGTGPREHAAPPRPQAVAGVTVARAERLADGRGVDTYGERDHP